MTTTLVFVDECKRNS